MSEWFDINGTAMIYIRDSKSIRDSKTTKEANHRINKECKNIIEKVKAKLQELTRKNPEIFDEISFEGFHPLGLDIRCFQNHAHGPSTDLDNVENGKHIHNIDKLPFLINRPIHVHNSATLTINGTIDTDYYEEHKQLFIDAFEQIFEEDKDYSVFRLNLITMWEGCQDAIIYDSVSRNKIITVPLTQNND